MSTVILSTLAKTFGPALGAKLLAALSRKEGGEKKLQRAIDSAAGGLSLVAALKAEFGDDFQSELRQAKPFDYEAGTSDYIKIEVSGQGKASILRDELNINLDRISSYPDVDDKQLLNQFRGAFGVWKGRYWDLLGKVDPGDDAKTTFDTIDELLDDSKRTFKEVLGLIAKTAMGTSGALLVISGVLLATGTGVSIAMAISIFLFGIPWAAVASLVVPGMILAMLSRVNFTQNNAMSTSVKLAYKLLDRLEKNKG